MESSTRIALTIAGSDSGGGAGIQADLKTFSALGVYGTSAITALTAQNTRGVQAIQDVPAEFVSAQIFSVFTDIPPHAIKIGMLSRVEVIDAVSQSLRQFAASHIVLDPVMVATSGDRLLKENAIAAMRIKLFPLADIITPNLLEAAALLNVPVAGSETEMEEQAKRLIGQGAKAVLLKGGHGKGHESVDILVFDSQTVRFTSPRILTDNTHGTGCTLSSAITAYLAKGLSLLDAVGKAKAYVTASIAAADRLNIGKGHGPTHHFHAWW
jgi:hydroxymethylpyrimidine/phosphomethylpyrimidine kinase